MASFDSWPPQENRQEERLALNAPGELVGAAADATNVTVTDISEHGVAFVSNHQPPPGEFRLRVVVRGEWQETAPAIALDVESTGPDELLIRARFTESSPIAARLREEMMESAKRRVQRRLFDD